MLVVLESLAPTERAVFVLREVFDMPYEDIATIVDKSPSAVRQLAHRSRQHTRARQPRFDIDKNEHRLVTERFLAACAGGNTAALFDLLAPEVVILSDGDGDGGGKARRPVVRSSAPTRQAG